MPPTAGAGSMPPTAGAAAGGSLSAGAAFAFGAFGGIAALETARNK